MTPPFLVRPAAPAEYPVLGKLMVDVYAQLDGFPKPTDQPAYYAMLANVGDFAAKPGVTIFVAASVEGEIAGGVVYFNDMAQYGSGGVATQEQGAAGFRLLAVSSGVRGQGVGKELVAGCLRKATEGDRTWLIIHSTKAMETAWRMYEAMGFKRSEELDFMQGNLHVFGFRYRIR